MDLSIGQRLLLIMLMIFIGEILNIVRSRIRSKKARDVEFSLIFSETKYSDYKSIGISVPIHDGGNGFNIIIENIKKRADFNCIEAMSRLLMQLFPGKYLVQVMVNGTPFPANDYLNTIGIHPFELGIRCTNNVLIHTPQSLADGSLHKTLTEGIDGFLIYDDVEDEKILALGDFRVDLESGEAPINEGIPDYVFKHEGFLIRDYHGWMLEHEDESVLYRFANSIIKLASENALNLNDINCELPSPVFDVAEISEKFNKYKKKELLCHIYIEDGYLVFHWRKGKKAGSQAINLPQGAMQDAGESRSFRLSDYLLPQKVEYRAYSRKNLLRFSLQYLLATVYLYGASFLVDYLTPQRFGEEPPMVVIMVCGICWLLGLMTFIMSLVYLMKALFNKASIIHPVAQ